MSVALDLLTVLHVGLSLVGLGAGFVVLRGFLTSERFDRATLIFLLTTIATSLTGFLFPFHGFTPALATGIISLLILPIAVYARYGRQMRGHWRWAYLLAATGALYLNTFVFIAQIFLKFPALRALTPNQNEPPFVVAQGVVFLAFIAMTIAALKRFHPDSAGDFGRTPPVSM